MKRRGLVKYAPLTPEEKAAQEARNRAFMQHLETALGVKFGPPIDTSDDPELLFGPVADCPEIVEEGPP